MRSSSIHFIELISIIKALLFTHLAVAQKSEVKHSPEKLAAKLIRVCSLMTSTPTSAEVEPAKRSLTMEFFRKKTGFAFSLK